MSNIILNIIFVSLIGIPMVLFMIRGNKKKSILKLKSVVQQDGLEVGEFVMLTNNVIAMDKQYQYLYYWDIKNDLTDRVELSTIDSAEVIKDMGHGKAHDTNVTILNRVDIKLLMKDKKQVIWAVFNIEDHSTVGSDLIDSGEFIKKVNKHIHK